jgi:hypothetical protein
VGGQDIDPPAIAPARNQGYLPHGRTSVRRVLPEPLSAIISFPELDGQPCFSVDVLDVSEGGLRLQLALPPDLILRKGEKGVISLTTKRSHVPRQYNFTVRWVEISSLISVAGVAFTEPLDLSTLPIGLGEAEAPTAKVPEQTH